jgi:recombination protein RecT
MAEQQSGATQIYGPQQGTALIQKVFAKNLKAMVNAAPRGVGDPNRLVRVAFNAIVYNPDLMDCTQASLIGGVLEAVKLGLTLGGPAQEAWLLPFRDNRNAGGKKTATFVVGYQGYRNLIDRSRAVLDLHPRAVYAGDEFDVTFTEDGPKLRHKPYYMRGTTKGELTHVYAVGRLRGGGRQVEVLTRKDVDAHRARSRAKDSGPWVTDYDAMALKTAIRVIAKYLPKSSDMALSRALDLDERADRGADQDFEIEGLVLFDEEGKETKPAGQGSTGGALERLKANMKGESEALPELRPDPGQAELTAEENAALDRIISEEDERGRK